MSGAELEKIGRGCPVQINRIFESKKNYFLSYDHYFSVNREMPGHRLAPILDPPLIDVKMDGTNYTYRCQAIEMYVKGCEKMRHLTGKPPPPGITDPEFHK
jgi:hypothetical protein